MKIIYAGSPLASAMVLSNLLSLIKESSISSQVEFAGVLTNPPSPKGRSRELIPTEVSALAKSMNIPVFEFDHIRQEAIEAVSPLKPDLLVTFDFGRIFGPKFLSIFKFGGINLHPSKLPLYRGCSPVPSAILNGDSELGISVQKIALETDTGAIIAQSSINLTGKETTLSLMEGDGKTSPVTQEGSKLLFETIKKFVSASTPEDVPSTLQTGTATFTNFIKKEDGLINWNTEAASIERKIRAYTPWPLCSTFFNGQKLSLLKAEISPLSEKITDSTIVPGTVLPFRKDSGIEIMCGKGTVLLVKQLQLQGKKPMDYKSFVNGARNFFGAILG